MPASPTFLVIGAMKAGTYSLHHYLDLHPQIEMSHKRKEVNFFVDGFNADRGLDWYRRHWRGDTAMRGESSTRYSMRDRYPGVAERIRRTLPDVKLIYVVRDPIRRLLSQYVHDVDDNQESRSFEELLASPTRDRVLNTGCYHYQLAAYLEHFPRKAIHLVCFEDLVADPGATMRPLLRFLGVDADFTDPRWCEPHNDSGDKRRETAPGRVLRRLIGRRPLRRRRWLREHFTEAIPPPVFDPLRHPDVVAKYRADTDRLIAFSGRDFPRWTTLYANR